MSLLSRKRTPFGPWLLLQSFLLPGLFGPGCGGQEGPAAPPPPPEPDNVLSCADLVPGDPRTGARFLCTGCSHLWQWRLREPIGTLYFLLDLDCRSTTGARLTLLDPKESPVWESEVRPGDKRLICIPQSPAPRGIYHLQLAGATPGSLTSFSGSIWINVFNQWGERLAPVEADVP